MVSLLLRWSHCIAMRPYIRGLQTSHTCANERCRFGWDRSVRKEVSLPAEQNTFSHAPPQTLYQPDITGTKYRYLWHLGGAVELLQWYSSAAVLRGMECGKDGLLTFEFKLNYLSQSGFTSCSARPHEIFKFKFTARVQRRSTYVLLIPFQMEI
jgi:hypothetical protein